MLNVTIQNDGKIKIQSECSNTKEMRHNVNLLLAVVSSMETEEAAAKKEVNGVPARTSYYLYLNKVEDNNKLTFEESIECYRVITGACEFGVRDFVKSNIKKPKKEYSIKDIINLTDNQYGNKQFKEFFKK